MRWSNEHLTTVCSFPSFIQTTVEVLISTSTRETHVTLFCSDATYETNTLHKPASDMRGPRSTRYACPLRACLTRLSLCRYFFNLNEADIEVDLQIPPLAAYFAASGPYCPHSCLSHPHMHHLNLLQELQVLHQQRQPAHMKGSFKYCTVPWTHKTKLYAVWGAPVGNLSSLSESRSAGRGWVAGAP